MWNFTVLGIVVVDGDSLKHLSSAEETAKKSQHPLASLTADCLDLDGKSIN